MNHSSSRPGGHDPGAEPGLENPVRDQARLGDRKYSVTPPRSKICAPADAESARVSCRSCRAELDPAHSYRVDGKEYVYHFCGAHCHLRWQQGEDNRTQGP